MSGSLPLAPIVAAPAGGVYRETGVSRGGSLKMISAAINGEERIMMSLFQRARDIAQFKANKALDAAEKPDEMLDLSYEQMLDQITQVRQGLVSVAASRQQLGLQEKAVHD